MVVLGAGLVFTLLKQQAAGRSAHAICAVLRLSHDDVSSCFRARCLRLWTRAFQAESHEGWNSWTTLDFEHPWSFDVLDNDVSIQCDVGLTSDIRYLQSAHSTMLNTPIIDLFHGIEL